MRENADRGGIDVSECCSSSSLLSGKKRGHKSVRAVNQVQQKVTQTQYVKKCGIAVQAQAQLPRPMLPTFPNLNYMKYI
jgi:hypothetical protein